MPFFRRRRPGYNRFRKKRTGYGMMTRKYPIRRNKFKPLTYYFTRWGNQRNLILTNAGPIGWPVYTNVYAMRWTRIDWDLAQMPGFAEFTNLFRYYKIITCKVRLTVSWDGADVTQLQLATVAPGLPGTNFRPMPNWLMCSLIDKSNQFSLTQAASDDGLTQAKQYSSFKFHKSDKDAWRTIHPKPLKVVGGIANTQATAVQDERGWIITSQANVPHYGLFWGISPNAPLNGTMPDTWQVQIRWETKFTVAFKGLK